MQIHHPRRPSILRKENRGRIRGIDTPEIRGKCAAKKRKARAARDYLRNLLKAASRIDLVDVKRGKYFRIIATVKADGVDVVPLMIQMGWVGRITGGNGRGGVGVKPCFMALRLNRL